MAKLSPDVNGNYAKDRNILIRELQRSRANYRLPEDFPTVEDMTPDTPEVFERLAREQQESDEY